MFKSVFYMITTFVLTISVNANAQSFFGSSKSTTEKAAGQNLSPVLSPKEFVSKVTAAHMTNKQQLRAQQAAEVSKLTPQPLPSTAQSGTPPTSQQPMTIKQTTTQGAAPQAPVQSVAAPPNAAPMPVVESLPAQTAPPETYTGFQTNQGNKGSNKSSTGQSSGGWNIKY